MVIVEFIKGKLPVNYLLFKVLPEAHEGWLYGMIN